MSVFVGHIHLDGAPVAPEAGGAMEAGFRFAKCRGFSRLHFSGGLMAYLGTQVTREDRFDRQPIETDRHVVVASARLDNRAALIRELAIDRHEELSDAEVLAAAYRQWELGSFDRLLGDWCCAVWDKRSRTLVLARDATGTSGVTWWSDGRQVVFSTTLGCVVANPAVPKVPDPLVAACFLTFLDDPETEDRTFFSGVRRVAPGGHVVMDGRGAKASRWWRPDDLPMLTFRDEQECDEAFMPLYRDAVHARLRRDTDAGVALMLSAGLDSGSVMALAAPELASRGARLRAYVHRPKGGGGQYGADVVDDEFEAASAIAQFVGHTDVTGHTSDRVSWVASIGDSVSTLGEPTVSAAGFYWLSDLAAMLASDGNRVLLTGQGGNGTVSWPGTGDFWAHARSLGVGAALHQLGVSRFPLGKAIRVQVFSPIKQLLRRRMLRSRFSREPGWREFHAIHPELAKRVDLPGRFRALAQDAANEAPFSDQNLRLWRLHGTLGNTHGARWMNLGDRYGFEVRDPTRDRRIVEFCWRLPDPFFWGEGRQRMLLRRNLNDLFPKEHLNHPIRGLQSSDMVRRALAEMPEILQGVDFLEKNPMLSAWIDVQLLRKNVENLKNQDAFTSYRILFTQIAPALAVAQFASAFSWS